MRAPEFWRPGRGGPLATLLAPLGWAYGQGTALRLSLASPWRAALKVVCVGNLVAGGAGKTPVALDLGGRLLRAGANPHFLTRGYGGNVRGPLRVDPQRDTAIQVGDEPLLLAEVAPTWVARDRVAGARAALAAGAASLVMDDGFQNPSLAKDLSVLVVDGGYGFGNGRVIPAGPLREPIEAGLRRADAVVLLDADETGVEPLMHAFRPDLPILRGRYRAAGGDPCLEGRPALAFSGISRPEKFFSSLRSLGCKVMVSYGFPDHHLYSPAEIKRLKARASDLGAVLVTTAKDAVRLSADERQGIEVLTIGLEWEDEAAVEALLSPLLQVQ